MPSKASIFRQQLALSREYEAFNKCNAPAELDPRVEALVHDLIGQVADKWTMLILEAITEQGTLRFSQIGASVKGISQKMLTQTLRQMEREGLLTRTVYPVVPPKVEYTLTKLGLSLGAAFCRVWFWAEQNLKEVEKARIIFDRKLKKRLQS